MLDDNHTFALCLTHDVDRPYRTYQPVYYAVKDRDPSVFLDALSTRNPYWTFEEIMELEESFDVRSAFYFLQEQDLFRDRPIRDWFSVDGWKLYAGRYSLRDSAIVDLIHDLDAGDWEVGLHGSYDSYRDRDRLRSEKEALEAVLGHPILGGRQHYLNCDIPRTWRYHSEVGLCYDSTLGSAEEYGFQYGYRPIRPFDDRFVVFPLTIMELTLPDAGTHLERAWRECERLLLEARENEAVMTVLWHPRYFNEKEFPGHSTLYRRLIERALELGAWVGPPAELWESLSHPIETDGLDAQ